ncbi:MAG TPA: deoxynucleoside kinase [Herpetosiphonaceae bacterium]
MGKLVTVVGNAGVGKTTLTEQLCGALPLMHGLEQHASRPFQQLFAVDRTRYALANQIDYLLLRAEQEAAIRQRTGVGMQDGGLDEDFYIFTRFFYQQGYLSADEFQLCQRMHGLLRHTLPPPDLVIYLTAPLDVVIERHRRRGRTLEIAAVGDLATLDFLCQAWLRRLDRSPVITVDASADDPTFAAQMPRLVAAIQSLFES